MTFHRKDHVHGWLRRKSQRLHTWSRRWFDLSGKFLFIYAREDDRKHQDSISLDKQIIVDPPVDPNDPKVGYFDIVNERSPSETVSLCAETPEEKNIWMRALKRALYADKGGALFSQSLEEVLFWEHKEGRQIPYIVDECVEYLYKYGLDAEGIFRLGGRLSSIKEVIARFERGEKIKFEDENTDIHVVSSVFKTFLRDLPDSVVPCAFFQSFMNIAMRYMDSDSQDTKELCIQNLAASMKEIPKDNYVILKYICRFLNKVAQHEDSNKMNSLTIGTIFGPNFLRHIDTENPHLHLCTADLGQHLVHMMLRYFDTVFAFEYKEDSVNDDNVPTADLLCISHANDLPVPLPRKKHDILPQSLMDDLEGIDLNSKASSLNEASLSGSVSLVEDFYSAPSSPFVKDAKDNVFPEPEFPTHRNLAYKSRTLHLSLKGTKHDLDPSQDPSSPTSDPGDPPIPPARRKTKKVSRNRRPLDIQRPNLVLSKSERPMAICDSLEAVDSDKDLDDFCVISPKSQTLPPGMSLSNIEYKDTASLLPPEQLAFSEPVANNSKLSPSHDDIKLQVSLLKVEIGDQRERYRNQLSELRAQLSEMQSKYEHRIEKMETESKGQKQILESKLEKERLACSKAVEKTMRLKEELHKYQMQYGELPSE